MKIKAGVMMKVCPECKSDMRITQRDISVCYSCNLAFTDHQQAEIVRLRENASDIDKMIMYKFAGATYKDGSTIDNDPLDAKVRYILESLKNSLIELTTLRSRLKRIEELPKRIDSEPDWYYDSESYKRTIKALEEAARIAKD